MADTGVSEYGYDLHCQFVNQAAYDRYRHKSYDRYFLRSQPYSRSCEHVKTFVSVQTLIPRARQAPARYGGLSIQRRIFLIDSQYGSAHRRVEHLNQLINVEISN